MPHPSGQTARPVTPSRGRLRPLGAHEVHVTGGFWRERQEANASATLDHCLTWMDHLGWISNFHPDTDPGRPHAGREFSDSEIYKLAEALAWEVGRSGSSSARADLRYLTEQIGAAQQPDGYLNTAFGGPGQPPRYSDLEWGHELYCYAFLFQAAVAATRAGADDDDRLLRIAVRAADHVCTEFGPDGRAAICGHPAIEMALVELARLTGERRYLDQAALFVDRRGEQTLDDIEFGRSYFQDDVPVRDADIFRGHAVRALYLAAGAVDVAVETGDDELLAAIERQWEATVARRTYLTGGMGSRHQDEAFGDDFVLPPDRAYSETCAGVASVMLSWRLLLATGNPRYADLAERTLFNVVATSTAPDGRAFFYANTLHQRVRNGNADPDTVSPRALSRVRAPWFAVSCCPNNVARLIAGLPAYIATADEEGVQLHQFAPATISTSLDDGGDITLDVDTRYPAEGVVTVRVVSSPTTPWTLSLRVPAWAADGARLAGPDGHSQPAGPGMASLTAVFAAGDEVQLTLPMGPRLVTADPRIDAVRGTVAAERGPLVMCAESVDLPDDLDVDAIGVDASQPPSERDETVTITGTLASRDDTNTWPYRAHSRAARPAHRAAIVLTPYHSWANRGPSTMRVWLPVTEPWPQPNV